jgi:hypothetical protein
MYSGIEIKTGQKWFPRHSAVGRFPEAKSQSYKNRASLRSGFLAPIDAARVTGFTEFSRIFDL